MKIQAAAVIKDGNQLNNHGRNPPMHKSQYIMKFVIAKRSNIRVGTTPIKKERFVYVGCQVLPKPAGDRDELRYPAGLVRCR